MRADRPRADDALPRLHRPEEVAAFLGCSAWWVKDRARRRLIPFTRVGRAYRFTGEHLAEIIRMNETRPAIPQRQPHEPAPKPRAAQPPPSSAVSTTGLRARPPRRARRDQFGTAA
ncbi:MULTISPECIES: helix-turn-helix domain-containing protein [unclassified Streptomyces]|uniref:helix-turn-helix domain-containing protein n=1 Tax=unclassified Streptomyces TaxID=2593676 RepID=UPI0021563AF8|nr:MULTISPECIES: helix-turn-helix domain-containing protein [unclassified Streptomyces]